MSLGRVREQHHYPTLEELLCLYPLKTTYELFFKLKDELLCFYLVCFILLHLLFHCCESEIKFKTEFN